MFEVASQFEENKTDISVDGVHRLDSVRALAGVDMSLKNSDGNTTTESVYEYGGFRVRFPHNGHCAPAEAILINTAGGMAGGDRGNYKISLDTNAQLSVTTQAYERIYRTVGSSTELKIQLSLADKSRLNWIPQGTLFYSGAKLRRNIEVDVHKSSEFLLGESLIFGRQGMGERDVHGAMRDSWRIRRDGRLIFADSFVIEGDISRQLRSPTTGNGAHCFATIMFVSPNAESKLLMLREKLDSIVTNSGLSFWNGMLCMRFISSQNDQLISDLSVILEKLTDGPLPRIWRS